MQTLIKMVGNHIRCYALTRVDCEGMWGTGRVVYVTEDGWAGVQLNGETRIDEYPADALECPAAEEMVQLLHD